MINKNQLYRISSSFSIPGKGFALMLWFIIGIWYNEYGNAIFINPIMYLLFFFGFYILFSSKYLEIIDFEAGKFKIRSGFGRLSTSSYYYLKEFKYGVIKKGSLTYKVKQGAAPGLEINTGKYTESVLGIYLFDRKNNNLKLLFKGKKSFVFEIAEKFVSKKLTVYNGAAKKGYELFI